MTDQNGAAEGIIDLREAFSKNETEPTAEESAVGSSASDGADQNAPIGQSEHSRSGMGKHARIAEDAPEPSKRRTGITVKKVIGGIIAGVIALVMAVVVVFVAYMRIAYMPFYDEATAVFETPGINSGFIPQDIDYVEGYGVWLFSGYEGEDSPSPIWKRSQNGDSSRVEVQNPDGSRYSDHGSGITSVGDKVYLTTEGGYLVLSASEIAEANDGDVVEAQAKVSIGFDPAFLNAQDGTLYTGVFYYAGPYDTPEKMHLTSPDGTQNSAIMYAFPSDGSTDSGFASTPSTVYSIPDKVQGVVAHDGRLVFSTSWGFSPSMLLMYNMDSMAETGTYEVDGAEVPLRFCDQSSLTDSFEAPPMMEGIDQFDGRIFLSNEAASNKYIFGKLYGAGTIYFLSI